MHAFVGLFQGKPHGRVHTVFVSITTLFCNLCYNYQTFSAELFSGGGCTADGCHEIGRPVTAFQTGSAVAALDEIWVRLPSFFLGMGNNALFPYCGQEFCCSAMKHNGWLPKFSFNNVDPMSYCHNSYLKAPKPNVVESQTQGL